MGRESLEQKGDDARSSVRRAGHALGFVVILVAMFSIPLWIQFTRLASAKEDDGILVNYPTITPVATLTVIASNQDVLTPEKQSSVLLTGKPRPLFRLVSKPRFYINRPGDLADIDATRQARIADKLEPIPTPAHTPMPVVQVHWGEVPVLGYHFFGSSSSPWFRTIEDFRNDLETLYSLGYYPVNLIDYVQGNLNDLPEGRRPVVLTFDDSNSTQFWYEKDGTVAPYCAIGVLLEMNDKYGDEWPLRATFFVLMKEENHEPGLVPFGQPGLVDLKLQALVDWGMEVGSHTVMHRNLRWIPDEEVQWELAVSQARLERILPGYQVRSLALPEGGYPKTPDILSSGYSELAQLGYAYDAVVMVGDGPAAPHDSPDFDPYKIPRIQALPDRMSSWLKTQVEYSDP
ncbi:MAG: polysaccharide deacetylase family protein [Chloroflexota bacterium]